jgi:hypothetical protein
MNKLQQQKVYTVGPSSRSPSSAYAAKMMLISFANGYCAFLLKPFLLLSSPPNVAAAVALMEFFSYQKIFKKLCFGGF